MSAAEAMPADRATQSGIWQRPPAARTTRTHPQPTPTDLAATRRRADAEEAHA